LVEYEKKQSFSPINSQSLILYFYTISAKNVSILSTLACFKCHHNFFAQNQQKVGSLFNNVNFLGNGALIESSLKIS